MGLTGSLGAPAVARSDAGAATRDASTTPDEALGLLMLAFEGSALSSSAATRLAVAPAAGVTLFRFHNVETPAQTRELTAAFQRAATAHTGGLPLLVAADQEAGQFQALGDAATPFAGNMALGAVGDIALTAAVGRAIGAELAAVGANVAYAPVCDVASDPRNPAVGIRSFGDDPSAVAAHAAAMVRGLRSAGVAATLKHFPGSGSVAVDPHFALPVVDSSREELDTVELRPFRAGIASGADLVMSGHVALPAVTHDPELPATLSRIVMHDLLRTELGFAGLTISDALDMRSLPQGPEQALDAIASLRAGMDLLLLTPDAAARERIETAVEHAARRGLLERSSIEESRARIERLRRWLAGFAQPDIDTVGSIEHRRLANELARRCITLVRNDAGLLPLRLAPDARVLAVMPAPRDLTPADTSSRVRPMLADALRTQHAAVDEIVTSHPPLASEIAAVVEATRRAGAVVLGTIAASADPAQADLVAALLATGVPTITVALRTPFDLAAYPAAGTHVAAYGILRPTLDALAAALFGRADFSGRLPTAIPGLYPTGHGLSA
jgi:beta-N-acetylhexosaminidase